MRNAYGMLDIKGEMGFVPIVDISTTLKFNEWASATQSFKKYSKGAMPYQTY